MTRDGRKRAMQRADQMKSLPIIINGLACYPPMPEAAFSNVWGASVLPSRAQDMREWPIAAEDLSKHYSAVSEFMPVAGNSDGVESIYPGFSMQDAVKVPRTPQAAKILLKARALTGTGLTIGEARNAASPTFTPCGACTSACAWDYAWTSSKTLQALQTRAEFTYRPGVIAHTISEDAGRARVSLKDGQTIEGARIFVACGVLETALIYLRSFPQLTQLTLLDSQHFFTPFVHHWGVRHPKDPGPVSHAQWRFCRGPSP